MPTPPTPRRLITLLVLLPLLGIAAGERIFKRLNARESDNRVAARLVELPGEAGNRNCCSI